MSAKLIGKLTEEQVVTLAENAGLVWSSGNRVYNPYVEGTDIRHPLLTFVRLLHLESTHES